MEIPSEDIYVVPTAFPKSLRDELPEFLSENSMAGGEGMIVPRGENGLYRKKSRESLVRWMFTDCWVANVLRAIIGNANEAHFRYDLTTWADRVQYTEYPSGGHYSWHTDTHISVARPNEIRKLSLSVLLSGPDEYEGGEFQILTPDGMFTSKPEIGTAIIFPSNLPHRVRKIRSGKRVSLVGWFGGPKFR
jgi:PKHD-type hydroxylase